MAEPIIEHSLPSTLASESQSPSSAGRAWLPALVVILGVLAVYFPTVGYQFVVWDDLVLVETNPMVSEPGLQSLWKIWRAPYVEIYMPITYSLWILLGWPAEQLAHWQGTWHPDSPVSPTLYHGVTLALFVGVAYRAYELLRRFADSPWYAAVGALLYACHPMQNETACWISENKGVLGALFGLWGLALYVDSVREHDPNKASLLHWKATILYALALLSKPSMVNVPLIALALDVGLLRRPPLRVLLGLWQWIALAGIMVWITRLSQPSAARATIPWLERPYIALDTIGFYLYQTFWPVAFRCDYGRSPQSVLEQASNPVLYGLLGWGILLLVTAGLFWWGKRGAATVIAVFLATLAPNLGFMPFAFQFMSTVADRYGAPALIAFGLAATLLLNRFQARWLGVSFGLLLAAALGLAATTQIAHWQDTEQLTANQLAQQPRSPVFLNNRAVHRLRQDREEEALADSRKCLEYDPDSYPGLMNVMISELRRKQYDEAEKAGRRLYSLLPDRPDCAEILTKIMQFRGRYDEALPIAKHLAELDPSNRSYRLRHARLLVLAGKTDEGLAIFAADQGKEKIVGLAADEIIAQVYEQAGEHKEALARYQSLFQRYMNRTPISQARIAWLQATSHDEQLRNPESALRLARQLVDQLALKSVDLPAYALDVLAAAEASNGMYEQARKHAADAIAAAHRQGNAKLLAEIKLRSDLYAKDQPFLSDAPTISDIPKYFVR